MPTSYPGALDNFNNPSGANYEDDSGVVHADQHGNANDAIEAIEAKVGTGSSTPAASKILMGTGPGASAWTTLATLMALIYPIGSIYVNSADSTNPGTLLGFGTWSAFGAGRVMVGFDAGQTEFDTPEETGGEKTHTLTTAEMPSHTHVQDAHDHAPTTKYPTTYDGSHGDFNSGAAWTASNLHSGSTVATNQNTGGGGAHNNLQPYITVYMWKRTA